MDAVRRPFVTAAETTAALKEANVPEVEMKRAVLEGRDQPAVYDLRWSKVSQALSDLKVDQLEAEVLWGGEALTSTVPLWSCARKMNTAIYLLSARQALKLKSGRDSPDSEPLVDPILFALEENDAFAAEVKKAVETAETFAKPHLGRLK